MKDSLAEKWLNYALSDLKIAKLSIDYAMEETRQICFHSQQCVEKSLKAFLIFKSKSFPKTHSIEYLHKLCNDEDPEFANLNIGELSIYASEVRYPQDLIEPKQEDAIAAYKIAKEVLSFILRKLKSESDLTLF